MAAPSKKKQPVKSDSKSVMGRPKTYTDEVIQEEASALLDWVDKDKDFNDDKKIYLGSFAIERGYHRKRIAEFAQKNSDFASAYQFAQNWQTTKFIKNALTRKWDPGFTQYVMARVCAPEWKKSWDKEEDKADMAPPTIIINKIEK